MSFLNPLADASVDILGIDSPEESAANTQRDAQREALAYQERIYNQQREDFGPYREMGAQGVTNYNNFLANPTAYLNSPAYQWQQQQIDKNMNRQLSARGRSNSSYGMNSLANAYGELGTREYTNAYNRMLDPIKIGQGTAAAAGSNANAMMGAYGAYGNNMSNIAANLYGNKQNSLYGGIATGLAGYNAFRNNNGGGGSWDTSAWDNSGYGGDSMDFSGNEAGSGAVDNYGDAYGG